MNNPIGIFDSGVGGLTVARQIIRAMPRERIVYFGDSARVPYGEKRPAELIGFSRQIVDFLLAKGAKAIVAACGTISATVFDEVRGMAAMPVMGMLAPAVDAALAASAAGRIGVIATAGAVAHGKFKAAIAAKSKGAFVRSVPCPLLAPLAEEMWIDNGVADLAARIYMKEFDGSNIDTLILGCTHYPLLINSIAAALPAHITIIDPAIRLAQELKSALERGGLQRTAETPPQHEFYISGDKTKFDKIAALALGAPCDTQVVAL